MLEFRNATVADLPHLIEFIRQLAAHEGRPDAATVTETGLSDLLFSDKALAEGFLVFKKEVPVAYAVTAERFSTFRGWRKLYIEDIFVDKTEQGGGVGRFIMRKLAQHALSKGCMSLEWSAIKDNSSARGFYAHLGAELENEHVYYDVADIPAFLAMMEKDI